jgi:hypothetical protein
MKKTLQTLLFFTIFCLFSLFSFQHVQAETPSLGSFILAPGDSAEKFSKDTISEIQQMAETPSLRIKIPGLTFSSPELIAKITEQKTIEGEIVLPFIGEYIAALYRFAVITVSTLAVIAIIISGFQWMIPGNMLTSGSGDSKQTINQAKERIKNALIGMGLAVGSFLILYTINPALVDFKHLSIVYVAGIPLEEIVYDNKIVPNKPLSNNHEVYSKIYSNYNGKKTYNISGVKGLKNPDFDHIFNEFSSCLNIDWRLYKAIAYKESRFKLTAVNNDTGFSGIFQTKKVNCLSSLRKKTEWRPLCNSNFWDPWLQTAVATEIMRTSLRYIRNACGPNPNSDMAIMATYIGHNSGPGVLTTTKHWKQSVFSMRADSCTPAGFIEAYLEWTDIYRSTGKKNWRQRERHHNPKNRKSRIEAAEDVLQFSKQLGVTNMFSTAANKSQQCPYLGNAIKYVYGVDNVTPNVTQQNFTPLNSTGEIKCDQKYNGRKILVIGDSITAKIGNTKYAEQLKKGCPNLIITNIAVAKKQTQWMRTEINKIDLTKYDDLIILGGVNTIAYNYADSKIHRYPEKDLEVIYKQAFASNTRVIALTITPWGHWIDKSKKFHPQRQKLIKMVYTANDWIKSFPGILVIDSFRLLADPNDSTKLLEKYKGDGLHFNAAGHTLIASYISQVAFN